MNHRRVYTDTKRCKQCSKEIKRISKWSSAQWAGRMFCSAVCQRAGHSTSYPHRPANVPTVICYFCKASFKAYKCHRNSKRSHCSRACYARTLEREHKRGDWLDPKIIVPLRRRNGTYQFSAEWRRNISEANKRRGFVGPAHPQWKGGYDSPVQRLRKTTRYAEWRASVFRRDNYSCQFCNEKGGRLEADHIKPFATYPEGRFDITNGRTLCKPCHRTTDTWGHNANTKSRAA